MEQFSAPDLYEQEIDSPYKQDMDDYDRQNFRIEPNENVPWDIKSEGLIERQDLEAVSGASSLEDALKAYDSFYPRKYIRSGMISPQYGLEMLLQIRNKFSDDLSRREDRGIANEAIKLCHAIDAVANKPVNDEKGDRTTLKGMLAIAEVIPLAQEYAPRKVKKLEDILRKVAAKVESRVIHDDETVVNPISGPIMVALEEFDKTGHDRSFEDILEKIDHAELNQSDIKYNERRAQWNKEREDAKKAEAAERRLALRKARISKELASVATGMTHAPATGMTGMTGMAMSLEELEADEKDDSQLVGIK